MGLGLVVGSGLMKGRVGDWTDKNFFWVRITPDWSRSDGITPAGMETADLRVGAAKKGGTKSPKAR